MNLEKLMKLLASIAISALVAAAFACQAGGGAKAPVPGSQGKLPGPRVIEMKVTENGYEPSPLSVKNGEPLRLRITRTTDATCAKEIILPEYGIEKELPLGETVDVELTPTQAGTLKYGCSMGMMIAGVIVVE